ncbi:unnamed protein product, partial [Discosporangium mesarthrocarpum]
MLRRNMAAVKENLSESVAQGRLRGKEFQRNRRSELDIVKTEEKFGTKHQHPCALCEQSFSEINLVLAVPYKVCAFCSQLFHDPLDYRPTWDMEVASMKKKRDLLAREKEQAYWDPLRQ